MDNPDRIVTIREYATGPDAYVALGALRNAGIPATVTDGLSTLYCPAPPPAGGYRLQVFGRDMKRALEILGDD